MNNTLNNIEEILCHQICGFHQYILTSPVHLNYVSVNLCEMLGIQQTELLDDRADIYAQMVHPADREKYTAFIQKIIVNEQALTGEYRLVRRCDYLRKRYRYAQKVGGRNSHRTFCFDRYYRY